MKLRYTDDDATLYQKRMHAMSR